jgi:hypothetical protein
VCSATVLVAEDYLALADGLDPVVGDGDPVRISAKIVQHLLRVGKRLFRIDDPLLLPGLLKLLAATVQLITLSISS